MQNNSNHRTLNPNPNSDSGSQNIGSRIMQNPSVFLTVDNNLTNEAGQVVIDRNISNQRTDQISGAPSERAYVSKLLASGAVTILSTLVSLTTSLTACEASRNKQGCREISSGLCVGTGLFVWSVTACVILARHAIKSNFRVHQAPSGDLPPPDFDLLNLPRRISLDEGDAPINGRENTGSGEVRSPSSPRGSALIARDTGRFD